MIKKTINSHQKTKSRKRAKRVLNISANFNGAIYTSSGGDMLCLPEDTLGCVLHEQKAKITNNTNWLGLLCTTITLCVVPFTSTFHSVWLFKSEHVKEIFVALCFVFLVWTVRSAFFAYKNRSKNIVREIIDKLKEQSQKI